MPRSLVGDAINVIISIDCSKAQCGSGGEFEAPPIGARTEDDKGSGLSLRIIELCVVPRSAIFFRLHSAAPSRGGKPRVGRRGQNDYNMMVNDGYRILLRRL